MKKEKQEESEEIIEEGTETETLPTENDTPKKTPDELTLEYLDGWKRCQAEFENYKKRQQESQKELGGYLIEKLVLDIIPVLDNFRAATLHVPPEQKESSWVVGIQYIEKQLEDVIKANGVEVIEAVEGDTFDPTIHEAVSSESIEETKEDESSEGKEQKIVKVLQKGFRLGGKVVRPAKVVVR